MDPRVIDWQAVAREEGAGGVVRQRIVARGVELVRVAVPAGTAAPRHDHAYEQLVQVLQGEGVLESAAGRLRFGPGSVFHLPASTWHAARFETDAVLIETNLKA